MTGILTLSIAEAGDTLFKKKSTHTTHQLMNISLAPTCKADLDSLVALPVEAMRHSLERIGRFDPVRVSACAPASQQKAPAISWPQANG